jgi:F-type H+-transporting ATPase subunit gamma
MATLREVRNRISGVKKTQKITKAMKMVAAAKMRRAQTAVLSARPYANKLKELLEHLILQAPEQAGPLLMRRDVRRVALVVVTADRGLCGAFNANILKAAVHHLSKNYPGWSEDGRATIVCVGKKGADFFGKRKYSIRTKHIGVTNTLVFASALEIARGIVDGYLAGEYDRVEILYNEFKSVSQQRIAVSQLLPLGGERGAKTGNAAGSVNYIYEPSKEQILEAMVPKHLNFEIWRALLESNAAEQGARMAAMENATENANEMIRTLQLQYNKARQAAITKELLEVVSGAEALRTAE